MMDKVHERPEGTAKRTFSTHKDKLIKEEDFYLVDFSQKNVLRTFGIQVPPRGLIVLAESGYLLLVKLFTDDLAWKVQRQLVNGYFKAIGKNNINIGPETLLPSEQQTLSEIVHKRAEGYGELQGKVLAEIWSRVHHKFRVAKYNQLPRTQLSEAILYVTSMEIQAGAHQAAEEYITSVQYHELKHLVYLISNAFHYKNAAQWATWATLRKALFAEAAAKIPASRYDDAKVLLEDIWQAAEAFKSAVLEAETLFFKRHFKELPSELEEIEQGLLS